MESKRNVITLLVIRFFYSFSVVQLLNSLQQFTKLLSVMSVSQSPARLLRLTLLVLFLGK